MEVPNSGFMHPRFDDFVLEVLDGRRRRASRGVSKRRTYQVRLRSPAGDLQSTMRLPWDQEELTNHLLSVENAILSSGGQTRRVVASERLQVVQDFGTALFAAVLGDEGGGLFYQSRSLVDRDGKGLRLRVRIEPPELASLPWEFLFDERSAGFIGLSTKTPIVRDLGLPFPEEPLAVKGPLRILGLVSSPNGLDALDIDNERARVERALAGPIAAGTVALRWISGTWEELEREILYGAFHVFHFIGHGGFDEHADEGLIALSDTEGEPHYLSATDLAMLLADEQDLRLVILNSCDGARSGMQDIFSSTASILVRRAIPAVLAMQYDITDASAIAFSRAFYDALAGGMPIDAAVAGGRRAVRLGRPGSLEWATPVLYQRAPDGVLFSEVRPALAESDGPKQKVTVAGLKQRPVSLGEDPAGTSPSASAAPTGAQGGSAVIQDSSPPVGNPIGAAPKEGTGGGSGVTSMGQPPPVGIAWLKSLVASLNVRPDSPSISEAKRRTIVILNVVNWIFIVILAAFLLDGLYGSQTVDAWVVAAVVFLAIVGIRQLGGIIETAKTP